MGRPAKRGTAAVHIIRFRVTDPELIEIEAVLGFKTLSDFARESVMERVRKMDEPIGKGQQFDPGQSSQAMPPLPDPKDGHRHKRGELILDTTIKGNRRRTWRCAEPGCRQELHG